MTIKEEISRLTKHIRQVKWQRQWERENDYGDLAFIATDEIEMTKKQLKDLCFEKRLIKKVGEKL